MCKQARGRNYRKLSAAPGFNLSPTADCLCFPSARLVATGDAANPYEKSPDLTSLGKGKRAKRKEERKKRNKWKSEKKTWVDFFRRFSNKERKKCLLGLDILGISILITFSSGKRCLLLVKYSLQGGENRFLESRRAMWRWRNGEERRIVPGGFPLQAKSGKRATVGPLKFELFASGEWASVSSASPVSTV